MTGPEFALLLFTVCNSVRVLAYLPQIAAVVRDRHRASAISYTTWGMFAVSHFSTVVYAWLVLADWRMAGIFAANTACCLLIVGLTAHKRGLLHVPSLPSPRSRVALLAGIGIVVASGMFAILNGAPERAASSATPGAASRAGHDGGAEKQSVAAGPAISPMIEEAARDRPSWPSLRSPGLFWGERARPAWPLTPGGAWNVEPSSWPTFTFDQLQAKDTASLLAFPLSTPEWRGVERSRSEAGPRGSARRKQTRKCFKRRLKTHCRRGV